MYAITSPVPQFFDLSGDPLDAGKLYIGTAGSNPITSPVTVYWDDAGTQPAAQPIRTVGGYPARNGKPARVYVGADDFSMAVMTRSDVVVTTELSVLSSTTLRDDLAAPGGSALVGADDGASGSLWTTVQGFINRLISPLGLRTIGFQQNYAAAVAQVAATPLSNIVSVSDFMTPQQVADMQAGIVKPDITTAFQAAVDAFPRQGSPNWQSWKLLMPLGRATLSGTVSILNQQGGELHMGGCYLEGNFAGPLLQVGDATGLNDVLWFHIHGGSLIQQSTAAGACVLKAVHNYSCSYSRMFMAGGQTVFDLDGNANLISACTFRGGADRNVKAAGTSNNEANVFHVCSSELSTGYGYDLDITAGAGGLTVISGGYVEANALGNIRCKNNQKVTVRDVYFNLQNGAPGVLLDGTVGANYPDAYVDVQGCEVLGTSGTAAPFIKESSATSINSQYGNNRVVSGNVDLYSQAPLSINLTRLRKSPNIINATSIVNTDATGAPDGWTLAGTGNVAMPSANSPYVVGTAAEITETNSYIYQRVKVPANALVRVSVWANITAAGPSAVLQLWSIGLGGQYTAASTTSTTGTKLTVYLSPAQRSSATEFLILLRCVSSGANAVFSDVEIEDMTN